MSFKLSDFTASPSQELLDLAKKSDLLDIADHYGLPNVKKTMLKHEIKNILIEFFVDEEIFNSSATSQILVTQTDLQLRELEIKKQVEMEKLRLEHENRIRVVVGHPEREKKILLAFLSTFWHPCSKCILMCFKKDRGGCQVWKCRKVPELGQRSTECKFL